MTELSPTNPELERFLFAPLHENGDAPLSVLSVLARQDIDPWQEAARLAQLPRGSRRQQPRFNDLEIG